MKKLERQNQKKMDSSPSYFLSRPPLTLSPFLLSHSTSEMRVLCTVRVRDYNRCVDKVR